MTVFLVGIKPGVKLAETEHVINGLAKAFPEHAFKLGPVMQPDFAARVIPILGSTNAVGPMPPDDLMDDIDREAKRLIREAMIPG